MPSPNLGADQEICKGDSLVLFPGTFSSYSWQDASTLNHLIIKQPGLYSVTVTNSCGTHTDEVVISEKECDIYLPNAFTPNRDGNNDAFKLLRASNLQEFHLVIYNRFGQKVFETKDYSQGWDGMCNGQSQSSGLYVWFCNYKRSNVRGFKKGTVLLIR